MALRFTTSYIEDALALFHQSKKLAERAMEQVTEEQLFAALDPESNSIAVIVKHLSGNMRSRWTDFLTTDGESRTVTVMTNSLTRPQPVRPCSRPVKMGGHGFLGPWRRFRTRTWCAP
jgi:Protein of unknown function (DUF1572)